MSRTHLTPSLLTSVLPLVLIACGSSTPVVVTSAASTTPTLSFVDSAASVQSTTALDPTTPALAGALPFDCASLEAVVAEAPTRFNKITGVSVIHETEAELTARLGPLPQDYTRRVYTADMPMPGAKHCELVSIWHGNADARMSQIAHVCSYPGVTELTAAFNAQLAQCLDRPADLDADAHSAVIDIDMVASGEGYAHTEVIANAQPLDGLRISVVQTICENRREGGCDDDAN